MDRDLIETLIESKLRSDIYTMLPAEVVSVADLNSKQTVNVKTLIGRLYEDGTNLPTQEIHNVPLIFPAAGGALLSFPIKVGDGVCLLFSMRDLDNWEDSNGREVLPTPSTRHHSITDAIAIAGLFTTSNNLKPNTTDVELKFANSSLKMKPSGVVTLDVASDYIVNVGGNYQINATGTSTMTSGGDFGIESSRLTHNGINTGEDHIHNQPNDSAGDTQLPTGAPEDGV
jgi:hypothetical protein